MKRPQQAGFTLLEVMIAIALTVLIGVTVASLVHGLVEAEERFATPPEPRQDARFARLLEDRLQALVVRPLKEGGRPLLNGRLDYHPDRALLEWVALNGEPVALEDRVSRVRRQRLSWDLNQGSLRLASAGLLDAVEAPVWYRDAQLNDIDAVEIAFYERDQWRQAPATEHGVLGLRLRWYRHGQGHEVVIHLPEVLP